MGAGASLSGASQQDVLKAASVEEIEKVCATLDAGARERLAQVLSGQFGAHAAKLASPIPVKLWSRSSSS